MTFSNIIEDFICYCLSVKRKIEKVPRGIRGEKSSKDKFEEFGLNNWSIVYFYDHMGLHMRHHFMQFIVPH